MTDTIATGPDYRGMGEHLPRLRADLEGQRLFRVQQLLDLAIRASRAPMATQDEQSEDVLGAMRAAARAALADIDRALCLGITRDARGKRQTLLGGLE